MFNLMKKMISINLPSFVNELNTLYAEWNKYVSVDDENLTGPEPMIPLLKKMKKLGIKIGNIDVSTTTDFGNFNSRAVDLIMREMFSLRELKNTKIEFRNYTEALELDKKEHEARALLNQHICAKIFQGKGSFFELTEQRIGFVYSGKKRLDWHLELTLCKVYKELPVFGYPTLSEMISPVHLQTEDFKKAA